MIIKQLWKENMLLASLWYKFTGTISVEEFIQQLKLKNKRKILKQLEE